MTGSQLLRRHLLAGEPLYRDAHYLGVDLDVDASVAASWLPPCVRLQRPARATLFTAWFPDNPFDRPYTEAGLFLERLLPTGSEVWLSRDVESRDQYGRLLAWIHRPDGVFVNLALVESGHATTLFFAPNDALETRFEQSAWQARREQRGFWTACGGADVVLGVVPFGS